MRDMLVGKEGHTGRGEKRVLFLSEENGVNFFEGRL